MLYNQKKIFRIGVTGGIGSGKSTVCSFFTGLGIPVLNSDDIAKELSNSNPVIRKKLINLLGQGAYSTGGKLDRPFVALKIFSDSKLQHKVESIIHPFVENERERLVLDLQRKKQTMVIFETALLFEAGLEKKVDVTVVVDAENEIRIDRVCKRNGTSKDDVRARINSQLNTKKKLKKGDYVIYNNGTLEELESKVRFLYNVFNQIVQEHKSV